MNANRSRRHLRNAVRAALLGLILPVGATLAASGDGSLLGKLVTANDKALQGTEITVINPETGFTRTVKVTADGSYRFPYLPVGTYRLEARQGDTAIAEVAEVVVNLGAATTADIELAGTTLDTVVVTNTRINNTIDISSTESATNITRTDLELLPVERDLLSVAMLAPGLVRGDSAFGGVSFGGSSVAENTVYINGLNVTDFYNRIGSSSVPYAFYKEFQVKTGGYSVEYGRTTGGVINAVTRSGTNEFEFGTEVLWEPEELQNAGTNRPGIVYEYDKYDRAHYNVYASGPIVKDHLFFFALYEFRDYQPTNTNNQGTRLTVGNQDDGFWGAKIDWQISDNHLLELLAFSDSNEAENDLYDFDAATGERGSWDNRQFVNSGGENASVTYTAYFTDNLQMKVLYGENERSSSAVSLNDIDCPRSFDRRDRDIDGDGDLEASSIDLGCNGVTSVTDRTDDRQAVRLDFEWALGDHQLRFGLDHENNTSNHSQFYPGDRLFYEIFQVRNPTLPNGATVPPGATAYVRTRQNEVNGEFETINEAFYLEDNWQITDNFMLNAGVRLEAFDNRNSDGDSYIRIDDMVAPRFGFSWDVQGDGRSKLFGNVGRYFLPVANVINIKQAGAFRDERVFYEFLGLQDFEVNGRSYTLPILGPQLGAVDTSQGDGTVGDLRGEVDADMDPVYQDEVILGFQSMFGENWSWGVRGIYRKLHNAIDDMEITSNGVICPGDTEPGSVGFVMGNPGEPLTLISDADCDGDADDWITIDTGSAGWALFDADGEYAGERGFVKPKRDYKALELVLDRAWDDKWALNATYTLSWSKGNAEGPVNSDTNFGDAGRTEAFDDPWVNLGGDGYLPNDRRHQFKLRGTYGIGEHLRIGATLTAQSGRPISAFGTGNPFDETTYHSYFICTANCDAPSAFDRTYELRERGTQGRTPWIYDLGLNATWTQSVGLADMQIKLAVYNVFNQERVLSVDEDLERTDAGGNPNWRVGTDYQNPRYGQLTVRFNF
jgi:hypothetical protein